MKVYELDLTNKPKRLFDPLEGLPMVFKFTKGENQFEFDVLDDRINKILGAKNMRVGFDFDDIPVGAVIKRLPDVNDE